MDERRDERVVGFGRRFQAAITHLPGGSVKIHTDDLRRLVREEPDVATKVVNIYVQAATQARNVSLFQRAMLIADAYHAEMGDERLLNLCKRAAEESNVGPVTFGFSPDRPALPTALPVAAPELAAGDVSSFVRVFDLERAEAVERCELSKLVGRCWLEFPLAHDPRPAQLIPEARRWVEALHQALPYFPCFLGGVVDDPKEMFITYFGCLAAEEAIIWSRDRDEVAVNIDHPSVLKRIVETLVAITKIAGLLDVQVEGMIARMLFPLPPATRDVLLRSLEYEGCAEGGA